MTDILLEKISNTHFKVHCDSDIAMELHEYFSEFAEGYKFHPLFKQRRWNGKIYFYNKMHSVIPVGLLQEIAVFANDRKYSVSLCDRAKEAFVDAGYSKEDFAKEIRSLNITAYGEPIEWRDYQMLGVYESIKFKRKLFSSNTSSGKSLIQYGAIRLIQDRIPGKILLIVPSTNLVEQMYSDFKDYSAEDELWYVEDNCARLYSEYDYDNSKQILISTWQSLQKRDKDFFEQFSGVLCDEAHLAKAKVISSIMEACINAEYRLAFTGTVPKDRANKLTITGHFGPVRVLQTSRQAMDKGYVSNLNILGMVLNYDPEVVKKVSKMKYPDEMDFICKLPERNDFICNLADRLKGNTLILTARVESHGKILYDKLVKESGKKIFYIFGEVKTSERERIRKILETETNVIVVGNFQILSTGFSVRNLHNLIFAFPSKSFTRVIQSVGRSLRKHESKDVATLIDICDNFGYSLDHFQERLRMYDEEQFDLKLVEQKIESKNTNSVFETGDR